MKALSLRTKLLCSLGVPTTILSVVMVALMFSAQSVRKRLHESRATNLMLAATAEKMKLDAVQVQQWLTDVSATRARDGLDDGFKRAEGHRASFTAGLDVFRRSFDEAGRKADLQRVDGIASAFESYVAMGVTLAKAYVADGPDGGNKLMPAFDATATKLTSMLDPFVAEQLAATEANLAEVENGTANLRTFAVVAGFLNLAVSVVFIIATLRSIVRPIREAVASIASGAEQTAAAAGQVSASSQELAAGASRQAAAIEESNSGVAELAEGTSRNSSSTTSASELVRRTREAADSSASTIQKMGTAVEDIRRSSEDVRAINKTIDEIAFQTNILALNAAVEAARAGEAGAGFAVVAEEVRNLARRSAEAARETAERIDAAASRASGGVELTARVLSELQSIVAQVRQIDEIMGGISSSTTEQSHGLKQISKAMEDMNAVTQTNAATAEETASASEELSGQAELLKSVARTLFTIVMGETGEVSARVPRAPIARLDSHRDASPASAHPRRGAAAAAPREPALMA